MYLVLVAIGFLSGIANAENRDYKGLDAEGIEMQCYDLNTGKISTAFFANTPVTEIDPSKIFEYDGVIEVIEPALYSVRY